MAITLHNLHNIWCYEGYRLLSNMKPSLKPVGHLNNRITQLLNQTGESSPSVVVKGSNSEKEFHHQRYQGQNSIMSSMNNEK